MENSVPQKQSSRGSTHDFQLFFFDADLAIFHFGGVFYDCEEGRFVCFETHRYLTMTKDQEFEEHESELSR